MPSLGFQLTNDANAAGGPDKLRAIDSRNTRHNTQGDKGPWQKIQAHTQTPPKNIHQTTEHQTRRPFPSQASDFRGRPTYLKLGERGARAERAKRHGVVRRFRRWLSRSAINWYVKQIDRPQKRRKWVCMMMKDNRGAERVGHH